MKKIKKLEFVQIHQNEQKEIVGGCFPCGCCIVCTCGGVNTDDNHGGGSGGGGTATCGCSGFCMPGDNADGAVQISTQLAQWQ